MLLKILLVEDDDNLANGIRYALEQEGWSVVVAGNVSSATDLYRSQLFHLILLDVMLPDGNGLDLCRQIRESSDIPVVFLTARDEEVDVVMGLESGGDDYIAKPFRLRELISCIKANVRKHSRDTSEHGLRVIRSGGITLSMTDFESTRKAIKYPSHRLNSEF
ncbi:MAG: Response regulator with CheY-like receiver domain and winged-helix DNA-binding domain [Thermotogales bacterium 46_20]|nr:MAG: Response regulator with CheY-like receiver domain and winged-helix DNA-binding domain [Thermotogales bacterium 46_20]